MRYGYSLLVYVLTFWSLPTLAQITSQTLCANSTTAQVNNPSPYFPVTWVNDNPAIGLPASGTGTIPSFVAQNPTQTTRVASVTVQPYYGVIIQRTFDNQTPITIPTISNGSTPVISAPYPSTILVIPEYNIPPTDIQVTLRGFSHPSPKDVDILLIGPQGQSAIILSDVGGSTPVINLEIRIGDSGYRTLSATERLEPHNNSEYFRTMYKPANINDPSDSPDLFPVLTPPITSTSASLSVFNGIDPRGIWSLYVVDDTGSYVGEIGGGWSISFTTTYPNDPNATLPDRPITFTYTINPAAPAVSLSNNAPQTCANVPVLLTATPGGSRYAFSPPATGQGNNTALASQAGVYSVTLTDANGCSSTATTTAMSGQLPVPTPTAFISNTAEGLVVQASGGVQYERPRDTERINGYEIRQTEQNQTGYFLIQQPGPYSISVIGANGCRATVTGSM